MPTPEEWAESARRLRRFLDEVEKFDGVRVEGNEVHVGEEEQDERDDRGS